MIRQTNQGIMEEARSLLSLSLGGLLGWLFGLGGFLGGLLWGLWLGDLLWGGLLGDFLDGFLSGYKIKEGKKR